MAAGVLLPMTTEVRLINTRYVVYMCGALAFRQGRYAELYRHVNPACMFRHV
jgi:hypothetical protein